jgi:hypothetical protein
LEQERIEKFKAKLEGKSLFQQFQLISNEIAEQRKCWQKREYRRHYQITMLDLTQLDKYGIPQLKLIPVHAVENSLLILTISIWFRQREIGGKP